ncbi:hypothetical protein NE237_004524 [Protea cynaroides]|uniref:Uncharacterized protein n=1 Tax=Protea cynaroides TaxID=273540 RepID=A0A9Q0QTF3_9MAGN|nr:hypothetical protein NE237_004524 [Protea cynaroides]
MWLCRSPLEFRKPRREGAKEGRWSCGGGLAGRQYHSGFPSFLFLLCLIRQNSTPAITNKESGEIERWGRCFGSTVGSTRSGTWLNGDGLVQPNGGFGIIMLD